MGLSSTCILVCTTLFICGIWAISDDDLTCKPSHYQALTKCLHDVSKDKARDFEKEYSKDVTNMLDTCFRNKKAQSSRDRVCYLSPADSKLNGFDYGMECGVCRPVANYYTDHIASGASVDRKCAAGKTQKAILDDSFECVKEKLAPVSGNKIREIMDVLEVMDGTTSAEYEDDSIESTRVFMLARQQADACEKSKYNGKLRAANTNQCWNDLTNQNRPKHCKAFKDCFDEAAVDGCAKAELTVGAKTICNCVTTRKSNILKEIKNVKDDILRLIDSGSGTVDECKDLIQNALSKGDIDWQEASYDIVDTCYSEPPPLGGPGLNKLMSTGCDMALMDDDDLTAEEKADPLFSGLFMVANFLDSRVDRAARWCSCL